MKFLNVHTKRIIDINVDNYDLFQFMVKSDQYKFVNDDGFIEADHPRDADGKFTSGGVGGSVATEPKQLAPYTTSIAPKQPKIPTVLQAKKEPPKQIKKHLEGKLLQSDIEQLPKEHQSKLREMYERAAANKDKFDKINADIAQELGGSAVVVPLKGSTRAVEKALSDYEGDPSQIKDLLRTTITINSLNDVSSAVEKLKAKYGEPKKFRNLLDPSKDSLGGSGYRDINMVIEINGSYAELQVNLGPMLEAKDKFHAHYEVLRSMKPEGKNGQLSEAQKKQAAEINSEMKAAYDAAWDQMANSAKTS
jgi:hypothetical protein